MHLFIPDPFSNAGTAPDHPFNDVDKAIDAAQNIYNLIPNRNHKGAAPTFDTLEAELRTQFSTTGSVRGRVAVFQALIKRHFEDDANY